MEIRVTAPNFQLPADSLVILSTEAPEGSKSQYARRASWLVKEGKWHRTTRPLYFKPGETFEYDGPITNRLLQSQIEVVKATAPEVEAMKTPKEKRATKKKTRKKA